MKTNILPIYMREIRSLFLSPVAWLVLAAFLLLTGYFWSAGVSAYAQYSFNMARQGTPMRLTEWLIAPFLGNVTVTFVFLLPLLSMRAFSEEKKTGTIETLFTLPFTDLDIVLGKWFASLTLLGVMLAVALVFPLSIMDKTHLHWPVILVGYAGVFMVGAAFLSVGMFTSSFTENQVVAAALGFGSTLLLFVLGWMQSQATGWSRDLIDQLSLLSHFQDLTKGVIHVRDLSYFVLFCTLCLFGTLRVLESKKWR